MRAVDRVTSISPATPDTGVLAAWSPWVLGAAYVALWTLTGRYWSLQHDAQIYVAQALALRESSPLAQDRFFRFRSQDEFTLFPTLAAPLIGCPLPTPAYYGGGAVFRTIEPFPSARPFGGAAGLAALAFSAWNRFVAALLIAVLACALHPLMAVPIVLMLVAIQFRGDDHSPALAAGRHGHRRFRRSRVDRTGRVGSNVGRMARVDVYAQSLPVPDRIDARRLAGQPASSADVLACGLSRPCLLTRLRHPSQSILRSRHNLSSVPPSSSRDRLKSA